MTLKVYESPALQQITGPTMRPGGLTLTRKAVSLCRLKPKSIVLDIGCGTGATMEYLQNSHNLHTFGLDYSALLLEQGRQSNPALQLIRGQAAALPVQNTTIHALFCECVLSLTKDPAAVLGECYRVLRPGGFFILTDLYQREPPTRPSSASRTLAGCRQGAMEKEQLQRLTVQAGFNIFCWEDHTPLLTALAARMVWHCDVAESPGVSSCRHQELRKLFMDNSNPRSGYCLLAAKKVV